MKSADIGMGVLVWEHWYGSTGMGVVVWGVLVWEYWYGSTGMGALVWEYWYGSTGIGQHGLHIPANRVN